MKFFLVLIAVSLIAASVSATPQALAAQGAALKTDSLPTLGIISCPIFCPDPVWFKVEFTVFEDTHADCNQPRKHVQGARVDVVFIEDNPAGDVITTHSYISDAKGNVLAALHAKGSTNFVKVCVVRVEKAGYEPLDEPNTCRWTDRSLDLCPILPQRLDDQVCSAPGEGRITLGFPAGTEKGNKFFETIRTYADETDIVCGENFRKLLPDVSLTILAEVFVPGVGLETAKETDSSGSDGSLEYSSAAYPGASWAIICAIEADKAGFCKRFDTQACDFIRGPEFNDNFARP